MTECPIDEGSHAHSEVVLFKESSPEICSFSNMSRLRTVARRSAEKTEGRGLQRTCKVIGAGTLQNGWFCQFLEEDLKAPLPRTLPGKRTKPRCLVTGR